MKSSNALVRRWMARRGSLVAMAVIFLCILFIVIMSYHWSSISTHKMFHHTLYSEKSIALLDGLTSISRGVVQQHLREIIEKVKPTDPASDLTNIVLPGGLTAAVMKQAQKVKLIDKDGPDAKLSIEPDVAVTLRMLKKDDFKQQPTTIMADTEEKTGKLEITVEVGFKGFKDENNFHVPRKTARTQFEFKKIRAVPPFFRHFNVFVKNGTPRDEADDNYADPKSFYNHLLNDRTGKDAIQGGAVFLDNGVGLPADKMPTIKNDKKDNPFYDTLPYVYLGGKNRTFLNLTSGGGVKADDHEDSVYGEDFQLYRGTTTDFYRVVSTEFSDFLDKAPATGTPEGGAAPAAGGGGNWLSRIRDGIRSVISKVTDMFKRALGFFSALDNLEGANPKLSMNLPVYYVVRKDYGYADDWGKNPAYRKFGFTKGAVVSSSLHLFNGWGGSKTPTPTVVLGNVYRRCLSLSGYKQRRAMDNPSVNRKFEVQAGPIEYFETVDKLFNRSTDWSKPEDGEGPIWVWDSRVDWSRREDTKGDDTVDGTYIPISGAGLFGRIVPGLRKFWEADKPTVSKLFAVAVQPPDRVTVGKPNNATDGDSSALVNGNDSEEDVGGGVSQIFVLFARASGFSAIAQSGSEQQAAFQRGALFGELGNGSNSAYFEEMMRDFCYTSNGVPDSKMNSYPTQIKDTLQQASNLWGALLTAREKSQFAAVVQKKVVLMDPAQIADDKKKTRWTGTAEKDADKVYPWSLPDPWSDRGNNRVTNNFEYVLKGLTDPHKVFDTYFKPMMTNPARALPYNYSLRFWFSKLREIFTLQAKDRLALAGKEVIPEIRDSVFGVVEGAGNEYMAAKQGDTLDPTLNDEVLTAIHQKRAGDAQLKNGYFFMDDYGKATTAPKQVDLGDIFIGDHYCYEEMSQQQFDDRFIRAGKNGAKELILGTVVKVKDFSIGNVVVHGGGAILSDTTIKITGPIHGSGSTKPLVLKAPDFDIGRSADHIEASLVATKEFRYSKAPLDCTIVGNVIAESWDPESFASPTQSRRVIRFDPRMKIEPKKPSYHYGMEPKLRKYMLEANQ